MNIIECGETPPTEDVLQNLLLLSENWEAENCCYGYVKNQREDIVGNRIFVALQGEDVIGYLFGKRQVSKNWGAIMPDGTEYFEIEELYVKPEFRSQGVGRSLFALVEDTARRESLEFLSLGTATKNYKAILHFYIEEMGMDFWSARLFKKIEK